MRKLTVRIHLVNHVLKLRFGGILTCKIRRVKESLLGEINFD